MVSAQLVEFTNNHWMVPLKPLSFMAYKSHLNKVFKKLKVSIMSSRFTFHLPRYQNKQATHNCNGPKDLSFIPDEAPARPPAQASTQLTPQRTKINTQEPGSRFFTDRADFICGLSIIWARQGNAWEDAPKTHSRDLQPNQTWKGLGPRDVGTGDDYGNGLIHQLAVLEK